MVCTAIGQRDRGQFTNSVPSSDTGLMLKFGAAALLRKAIKPKLPDLLLLADGGRLFFGVCRGSAKPRQALLSQAARPQCSSRQQNLRFQAWCVL